MFSETLASWFSNDLSMTLLLSTASLIAVCVPFNRAFKLALRAMAATRYVGARELDAQLRDGPPDGVDRIVVQMLRTFRKALDESRDAHPIDFLVDASRQYVMHDYDDRYARPISMASNILPPIGFIGTTGGLLILFLSMRLGSDSLELGALALALTSSIFALVAFAILEGLKIRLYRRLMARLDDAISFQRGHPAEPTGTGENRVQVGRVQAAARTARSPG